MLVCGRVPVWVEEDEPVRADEIDTAAPGLTTEKKDKLLAFGVVKFRDKLRAFCAVHCAVES